MPISMKQAAISQPRLVPRPVKVDAGCHSSSYMSNSSSPSGTVTYIPENMKYAAMTAATPPSQSWLLRSRCASSADFGAALPALRRYTC